MLSRQILYFFGCGELPQNHFNSPHKYHISNPESPVSPSDKFCTRDNYRTMFKIYRLVQDALRNSLSGIFHYSIKHVIIPFCLLEISTFSILHLDPFSFPISSELSTLLLQSSELQRNADHPRQKLIEK